ncbi:hypothetical protein HYW39_00880 [Candidatus Curtissbacteria bacterium]|nr:hypothetical protein [Candidatus Curtissbacteria bacterium]
MTPESEHRIGRLAPQRMFDSLMENMIGWGKSSQIEEETYDSLTVFKHPIDADPNDELGLCGDETNGRLGPLS